MTGYPFEATTGFIQGSNLDFVIPINTAENVRMLHLLLFDNHNFTPSQRLQGISGDISYISGVW
jgi:hypothetical protein